MYCCTRLPASVMTPEMVPPLLRAPLIPGTVAPAAIEYLRHRRSVRGLGRQRALRRGPVDVTLENPSGQALAAAFELNNRTRVLRLDKVRATYKPGP